MDLDQLKTLSALKYQHSHQALAGILARESELRTELDRLRKLTFETQSQPAQDAQLRAIGADIIWLKWLGHAQRRLNIVLAQVLAQKEALMVQHRRANGRKIVAEELASQAADLRRSAKRKAQLNAAIHQALLK